MFGIHVDGIQSPCCDSGEIVGAGKETSTGCKVYGECSECGHDFGRVGYVSRDGISHIDEMYEEAENVLRTTDWERFA